MVRYFHQPPDYWLDHCTLRDWTDIYARELEETPPTDEWAGIYFNHQPSPTSAASDEDGEPEEWVSPYPETTE